MDNKNLGKLEQAEQLKKQALNKMVQAIEKCQTETSYIGTDFALRKWNNTKSEELRERQLARHIDQLFLNKDLRMFLAQSSYSFSNVEKRVVFLKLCRKILAQNPKRKIPRNDPYFRAFEEEFLAEIENDIELDPIKWIDEELQYIAVIKQLEAKNQTATTAEASEKSWLKKEESCERYGISASTFDRWRKNGFPCQKHGGKLLTNKDAADRWITENSTIKKRFSFA